MTTDLFDKTQILAALDLDYARMESASDRLVALATELGVTRREMASMCMAMGANHMIATGVERERALLTIGGMYDWRVRVGLHTKLLVPG